MRDILGPVLRGEVALDQLDHTWLLDTVRMHHPAVPDQLLRESYRPGRPPIHALWWHAMEGPLLGAGASEAELLEWQAVVTLENALDYPLEKLFETVQYVGNAIRLLEVVAETRGDPAERSGAYGIAGALAYAFATIDVCDDGYDLRKATAARLSSRPMGHP